MDLDFINRKDLICCPSTKSTPLPPSGELTANVPPIYPQPTSWTPMRTTPRTTPKPSPVKVSAPDAMVPFERVRTTIRSKPALGQWGHRLPSRRTTTRRTPTPVHPNEIDIFDQDSEKLNEDRKPVRPTRWSPVKKPDITGTGSDASVPVRVISAASPPSKIPHLINPGGPRKPVQSKPVTKPNLSEFAIEGPSLGDEYVPVISVGSMTPDDSVIVELPSTTTTSPVRPNISSTPTAPLQETTSTAPQEEGTSAPPQKKRPKPHYPDASAVGYIPTRVKVVKASTPSPIYPSEISPPASSIQTKEEIGLTEDVFEDETTTSAEIVTTTIAAVSTPSTTQRPKFPLVMDKAPCGILNSEKDPKYPWVVRIKFPFQI